MSKSESPVNDAVRVLQIKALLREIDVIVCMYPYAFAFQQLAKVIGISSQKSRHFFRSF